MAPKKRRRLVGPAAAPPTATPAAAPPAPFLLGDNLIDAMLLSIDPNRSGSPVGPIEQARLDAQGDATKKPVYETAIRSNPIFKEIEAKYGTLSPLQQQLANLTSQGLVNLEDTGTRLAPPGGAPVHYGTLEGVDLLTTPHKDPTNPLMNMDFYDLEDPSPTSQRIVFSPNTGSVNPIIAFTHEGRHALDDLYKRPHQQEAINFLVEEEKRNPGAPTDAWLKPLLEGAQKIIRAPTFKRNYPYTGTSGFKENVDKSFINLKVPIALGSRRCRPSTTFEDAKKALDKDRLDGKASGDAFMGLSEFPAFMTEELGNTFQGPTARGINNISRRFIKENLRTMYRDYDELTNGDLSNPTGPYPDVKQAFYDRYNELRKPTPVPSSDRDRAAKEAARIRGGGVAKAKTHPLPTTSPFPVPKYTTRAKGGHVKNSSKNNFDIKRQLQLLALLSPRLKFL